MPTHDSRCVFCRIATGEAPASMVFEDDEVVAFRDVNPQAPVHVLVVPRRHIGSLQELRDTDGPLAGRLLLAVTAIARMLEVNEAGYRVVINVGREGGQTVGHLHLHLLAGRQMRWRPADSPV